MGGRRVTNREIRRMHELREDGVSGRKIAKLLGRHKSVIEFYLYPSIRAASARRAERDRALRREFATPHAVDPTPANRVVPPDYVLAERDARLSRAPRSLTALLMGDPV